MRTWHVFVVELDGQHVAPGLLRTNTQREREVVSLYQLTDGRLAHPHALRRQRTCHSQPITARRRSTRFLHATKKGSSACRQQPTETEVYT